MPSSWLNAAIMQTSKSGFRYLRWKSRSLAPVVSEIKAALYPEEKRPKIVSFVGGLGGRDIRLEEFEYMVKRGSELAQKGQEEIYETIGIR